MRTADGRVGTARRGMVAGALHTSACAVLHESTNSIVKPRTMLMSGRELVVCSPCRSSDVCVPTRK